MDLDEFLLFDRGSQMRNLGARLSDELSSLNQATGWVSRARKGFVVN